MTFEGKRVIVTGAGRGLGAALAVVLADQGAEVMLTGRNTENLTSLAESMRHRNGRKARTARSRHGRCLSAVTLFAKGLRDAGRPLDILVNNAAQWLPGRMDEHDALAISQTIAANVTGTLLLTRGLMPLLEKSGAGDIMNIVSISGLAKCAPAVRLGRLCREQAGAGRHQRRAAPGTEGQTGARAGRLPALSRGHLPAQPSRVERAAQ
jgi:short-subunit dehydrogenase